MLLKRKHFRFRLQNAQHGRFSALKFPSPFSCDNYLLVDTWYTSTADKLTHNLLAFYREVTIPVWPFSNFVFRALLYMSCVTTRTLTDVSKELAASMFRVVNISSLGSSETAVAKYQYITHSISVDLNVQHRSVNLKWHIISSCDFIRSQNQQHEFFGLYIVDVIYVFCEK